MASFKLLALVFLANGVLTENGESSSSDDEFELKKYVNGFSSE